LRSVAQLMMPGQPALMVRTFDIGIGGVGIIAPANLPALLSCRVRIAVPVKGHGSTTVEAQAKVVHSVLSGSEDGFRIGLQFVDLPPVALAAIKQFLLS
jgi:c-di-GMP-binding flagellar brake protein YcgR